MSMVVAFQDYGKTLDMVMEFKYFGLVLNASEDNWFVVVTNLWKNRSRRDFVHRHMWGTLVVLE